MKQRDIKKRTDIIKTEDWTFEDLKARINNEYPITENEDGSFSLHKRGGGEIIIGKREEFDLQ